MKKYSCIPLLALLFLLCGCEALNEALEAGRIANSDNPISDSYRARFVVGVFTVVHYPRATELEKELDMPGGRTIAINTNQSFSSSNLRDARVVSRPGNPDICDLQLKPDRAGMLQWEMLAGNNRGEAVVLVVDGRYMASFIPEMPPEDGSEWITLRVGIDPYTAKGIARYAKKNYDFYNPDSSSWFNYL